LALGIPAWHRGDVVTLHDFGPLATPHPSLAPEQASQSRQDAGKLRWIARFAAFAIPGCRDLPGVNRQDNRREIGLLVLARVSTTCLPSGKAVS
jgi:hypothetical protein